MEEEAATPLAGPGMLGPLTPNSPNTEVDEMHRLQQILETPVPALSDCSEDGNGAPRLDSTLYLKRWLLDVELKVRAAHVARHRMLKDALHALVVERFGEQLDTLVGQAVDELYVKLCACPEDEQEADTPDGYLPIDLPPPDKD